MAKARKKRLKVKWKNVIFFLIALSLIIFGLIKGTTTIFKIITTPKSAQEIKEEKKVESKEKPYVPKVKTSKKDKSYNKGDNSFKKLSYYHEEYLDRYIKYKKENPSFSDSKIVTYVNIGLDYPYYENVNEAKYLNKDYILVNKYNYLKSDYVPKDLESISLQFSKAGMKLVKKAKESFEKMAKDAKISGYSIIAMSTYRSYNYQVNLYKKYVKNDGVKRADTYSGRAGYSEHQTGLAVDVCTDKYNYTDFEKSKEFEWMQKNAYKYGFILRFPKGKEKETGYEYESWHYRYVGEKLAEKLYKDNITLEEYYATNIIE